MFKTVIILCIVAQQQCFQIGNEKEHGTVYRTEAECQIIAEKLVDELEKQVIVPAFVRYGCEEVNTI